MEFKTAFFLFLFSLALTAKGQFSVSSAGNNGDPDYLASEILVGGGVSLSNISWYGSRSQFGFFTGGDVEFGMDSGIVICSGNAEAVDRANNLSGSGLAGEASYDIPNGANQGGGDADLTRLAIETAQKLGNTPPNITTDAASISFNFIPVGDSIKFRFAFASEEYPEYVGSQFNDIFGFFIAGPGLNGPFSAPAQFPNGAINLAQVPQQDLAITVSSINEDLNSQYYVDNQNGLANTHHDGFTVLIEVSLAVESCQEHYFKLAIADGEDGTYDSAVLIEASSFSSSKFEIAQGSTFQVDAENYVEGCGNASLSLSRAQGINFPDTVLLQLDASSEADFNDISDLPDTLIFAPGERRKDLIFQILNDGLAENAENLVLRLSPVNGCFTDELIAYRILDYREHEIAGPAQDTLVVSCTTGIVQITPVVTGGYGFYKYSWTDNGNPRNEKDSILTVSNPAEGDIIELEVGDTCSSLVQRKSWYLKLKAGDPLRAFYPARYDIVCPEKIQVIPPDSILGGTEPITSTLYNVWGTIVGSGIPLQLDSTMDFPDGPYFIETIDACGTVERQRIIINNEDLSFFRPVQNWTDTAICLGNSVEVSWTASGGGQPYYTQWPDAFDSSATSRIFTPTRDTTITLIAKDFCGSEKTLTYFLDAYQPRADFEVVYREDKVIANNFSSARQPEFFWYLDSLLFSRDFNVEVPLTDYNDHDLSLVIVDAAGCTDSLSKIIGPPLPIYVPRAFTPNGDGLNDVFLVSAPELDRFELWIFDRLGNQIFYTDQQGKTWDGKHRGTGEIVFGTYVAKVIAERGPQRKDVIVSFTVLR
ncbi:MAG: choice-of-anchor L domain-containing protein [Luteibaculum sp.]